VKVGCIGLGDIARKVYLPVLGLQPGIDLHLQTRPPATLHRVAASLHVPQGPSPSPTNSPTASGWCGSRRSGTSA
jgi:virulence factor